MSTDKIEPRESNDLLQESLGVSDVSKKDNLAVERKSTEEQHSKSENLKMSKKSKVTSGESHAHTFSRDRKKMFLELLPAWYPNVWKVCALVGIHKVTVDKHLERDVEFSNAVNDIIEQQMDRVEGYMFDQAFTPKGFLDRIAMLKAHRPEKWNPKSQVVIEHKTSSESTEASRHVLETVIAEDAAVIEATTGQAPAPLPIAADSIPPDLDAMDQDSQPEPENQPTPTETPKIHEPPNARAGVLANQGLDVDLDRGYTSDMNLDPFDLSRTPPKKTNPSDPTHTPPPLPPSQKNKRGRV